MLGPCKFSESSYLAPYFLLFDIQALLSLIQTNEARHDKMIATPARET